MECVTQATKEARRCSTGQESRPTCDPTPVPPYTQTQRMLVLRAKRLTSFPIWTMSSRVGAMISATGPSPCTGMSCLSLQACRRMTESVCRPMPCTDMLQPVLMNSARLGPADRQARPWSAQQTGRRQPYLLDRALVFDVPKHGQHKGKRFAGARLCNAQAVTSGHDGRESLGLDGQWGFKPRLA